jgi:SAM-dependent methyltransferase
MSGFSVDWLALREDADHRARNAEILAGLAQHLAGRLEVTVVDLGCGTGSNLRAVAPSLPVRQSWRLVDHDPALLAAAREKVASWGDRAETSGSDLRVVKGRRVLTVSFVQADLATGFDAALGQGPDLVTAAALFDLVSVSWLEALVSAVAARRSIFYTALTYDGSEQWMPPHREDAAVLAAFHRHQSGDKGFGPAAGPQATGILARAFSEKGYSVREGASPWHLGTPDAALIRQLAEGIASAALETQSLPDAVVADWHRARLEAAACRIGHLDLLACP